MTEQTERQDEIMALLERAPGKRPNFLDESTLDHMFAMIMELASQMWVMRERLYCYEAVMSDAGIIDSKAFNGWTANPDQSKELGALREDMLRHLFRTVLAKDTNSDLPDHTEDPVPPG